MIVKEVGPLRVAELTASVDSYGRQDIEPTLQLLYPELSRRWPPPVSGRPPVPPLRTTRIPPSPAMK